MTEMSRFTKEDAQRIGDELGVDWEKYDIDQLAIGMNVELEHGLRSSFTNVTNDDPVTTTKIAMAHLDEFPDYYTRLEEMEQAAEAYWEERRGE